MWMVFSFAAMDMILHMGLGFGIPEIYIMAAHWIYVIPISMGFLMKAVNEKYRQGLRFTLFSLTAYLTVYNVYLLVDYLYL